MSLQGLEIKTEIVASGYGFTVAHGKAQVPHYVSPEDKLVSTLLDVYHRQTDCLQITNNQSVEHTDVF